MSLAIASGVATVTQENGSQITFNQSGTTFTPATPRVLATLVQNGDGTYTLTRKKREIFNFDSTGKLTSIKDLNNYTTTVTRPSSTSLVVTDPAGRTLSFTLSSGHITGLTDPAGRTMSFTYDGSGNLTDVVDVGSGHTVFTYDTSHRLLTMRAPKYYGDTTTTPTPVTTNHYDTSGRVDWQSDPLGRTTYFDYTTVPGSTKVTDPKGNAVLYTYQYGTVVSETRGYGTSSAATWSFYYDPATVGLTSITDPNGKVTQAYYDSSGNKVLSIDALSNKTSATYDSLNDLTSIKDPLGVTTSFTYDSAGNLLTKDESLTSVTPTEHEITTWSYDSGHAGDVLSITDPLSHATTFTYNATTGDLTSVTDATGNKTTFAYNTPTSIGWVMSSVAPKGNVTGGTPSAHTTTYARDSYGRITTTKDPLWSSGTPTAHQTVRHYDGNGNLDSFTDGDNHATTYSYNAADELITITRPDSTTLSNEYWADGSLKKQIDGASKATTYAYDALGRVTSVTDPNNRATSYTYDGAGNVLTKVDPSGTCTSPASGCTTFTYDAANQLKTIAYSDGTTPGVTYNYDAAGRRTSMVDGTGTTSYSYDSLHRLTSVTNGASTTVSFGYDRANRQTSIVYPGTSHTVTKGYDNANRLTSVTDWLSNTNSFGYDANGNLTTETAANGVVATSTYDNANQLMGITDDKSGTTLAAWSYGRDGAGLLTSSSTSGALSEPSRSFGYDSLNRLTSWNTTSYGYDNADNPTSFAGATQAFDDANQLTSIGTTSFSYDSRGNRTAKTPNSGLATSFAYDQGNRLKSITNPLGVSGTYTYAYNGDGLRASKTVSGSTEAFVWDVSGSLPMLLQDGTNYYLYGPQGRPIEQINSSTGTVSYFQHDQLGSTKLLTNSSGATVASFDYDPYGNVVASSGTATTPLTYAGEYTDAESGLHYLRARFYDSTTGQFLSRDPVVSLTRSAYGYVADSPVNGVDPSGLLSLENVSDGAAGVQFLADSTALIAGGSGNLPISGGALLVSAGAGFVGTAASCTDLVLNREQGAGCAFGVASLVTTGGLVPLWLRDPSESARNAKAAAVGLGLDELGYALTHPPSSNQRVIGYDTRPPECFSVWGGRADPAPVPDPVWSPARGLISPAVP